jgi:hypothetical protein
MGEMQQVVAKQIATAPATPQAPALPPPAAQAPVVPGQPSPLVDLSKYSVNQLRKMLSELRDQRQQLASRREGISGNYERATGDNQKGIGERLRVLDANIVSYEAEITRVGREIAVRGGQTSEPPPNSNPGSYVSEDDAAGMAFGFSFMTAILVFFVTRRIMRRKYMGVAPGRQQSNLIASNERLERIEQAVDTIAVEVERVSENQRFMTRLMTETQLGENIKDVRKSTELAKSAAESSG